MKSGERDNHLQEPLSEESSLICIATCTRGRPKSLQRMLESFVDLHVPDGTRLCALIVENDEQSNLQAMVESSAGDLPFPLHYAWESKLGIPIARNRCIREAQALGASHIVFIDDKERAHPEWLLQYQKLADELGQEAFIEGQVESVMPLGVPEYMPEYFQREVRANGAEIQTCTTANVWMPMHLIEKYKLRFDETDPFAGGTDTKLFTQARESGAPLHYCVGALVYEDLPAERFNWDWLAKRRFRCGVTDGELQTFSSQSARRRYIAKRAWGSALNALKALLYMLVFSRKKALKYYLKAQRKAGELMGARGHKVASYQSVDGH